MNRSDSCLCPKEFSGPHCEFLNHLIKVESSEGNQNNVDPSLHSNGNSFLVGSLSILFSAVAIALLMFIRKRKNNHERNGYNHNTNIALDETHDQFYDDEGDEDYVMRDIDLT